jgi:hypothetical protein
MPQLIVVAIAYASYGYYAWQFWAVVALTAYSSYQQSAARRKARSAYNDSLKDRLVSVPVSDAPRARVYGRARCADGIIYKATHGTNKENFTLVLALAGHEIDAVEQVYFNDQAVTLDGSGYVTTAPWYAGTVQSRWLDVVAGITTGAIDPNYVAGSVSVVAEGGDFRLSQDVIGFTQTGTTVTPDAGFTGTNRRITYQTQAFTSKARVRAFNGAPGQDLSTVLAGLPGITSAHKFQGIACLVIDLTYDQDAFPMGPPSVSAVVRGAKLFDPRTGTTAWSENPGLIARDWALNANGGGATVSDLDEASFTAAANACDVTHNFTTVNLAGASSSQVLPIYTAGLVARTDQAPDEVLAEIISAMAGRWAWAGGRLRIRAGTYAAPVATLTEDWVSDAGDIDVVSTLPRTELFNVLVPSIANRDQGYVVSAIPRVAPAEYIATDGGEYPREVSLAAVTDTAHAAHVCGVMLRDARQALTVTLSCNLRALVLELFDVVAVTLPRFGWSAKPFEVLGWSFTQEGGIKLTLKETDASIYNPDASFTRADAAPNTGLPDPFTVPNVAPTAIDSGNAQLLKQADGTIISRMRVTWAAVQDEAVRNGGSIEVRYGPADSSPTTWQTETVAGTETQALLANVQDGRVYVVTTRARNKLVAGAWSLHQSHVVRGKSAPPSDVAGLAATSAPGAVRLAWTPCPDADYALTELRVGSTWVSATRIWRGTGSGFEWSVGLGSYTILARHEDTSGNLSTSVASVSGTVVAVVSGGAALNADPNTLDASAWTGGALSVLADSAAPTGRALEITSTGATTAEAVAYPIDPARNYQLRIHARQVSGSSTCYLGVDFQDASGASILGETNAVGWPNGGTYFYFGLVAAQPPATFTQYTIAFGPSETAKIPAAARYARIIILGNYTGSGVQRFSGIRLEDLTAARLASDAAAAAQSTANAAQTTANTASTNATSALTRIAAIDSDGILARGEKPQTLLDYQALADEYAGILAQANAFGIGTEKDNYNNAFSALSTYLSGLSPSWNDTSQDTTIVPAVYRAAWADVYAKRQALLNKIADEAGKRAQWTQVTNRPASYRVGAVGYLFTGGPMGPELANADTGAVLVSGSSGYRVVKINRSTKAVTDLGGFFPLSGGLAACNAMASALDGIDSAHVAVVWSYDEPQGNRLLGNLPAALYRCGASRSVWGSSAFRFRSAYILVGIGGCGEGNGAECYAGAVDSDPNAWCDTTFQITQLGALIVNGAARGATTLVDYGYTGDLAATRNDVYQQASDPGAVANGSIWLDTSTGKAWQRVGGAWVAYVGTGSVGTGQLAGGAATMVQVTQVTGPFTVDQQSFVPHNSYGQYNQVAALTFTPSSADSGNVEVLITVTAEYTLQPFSGIGNTLLINLGDSAAFDAWNRLGIEYRSASDTAAKKGAFMHTKRISVPGNVSRTVALYAQVVSAASTLEHVELRAEVIRR